LGVSIADETKTDADGRIALGTHSLRGLVVHGDDFAGVNDFDGKAARSRIAFEISLETVLWTDEKYANAEVTCGLKGAFDFRLGRPIRTHRVQGYGAGHRGKSLSFLFDSDDFAALVVAALGAGAMRHFLLVAIRALGE
jgi:hypothetical protein